MPILEAETLTKTYGKGESALNALDAISLKVEKGESIAILGKSGSGKSTLMHLLALLDTPTHGSVLVDDTKATRMKAAQVDSLRNKMFGFVFQQFFLNANKSVLENVILPLKIAGISAHRRNKRGMEVLEAVGLSEKANVRANDLSGGQKQRVVIARALVNDPKVIFADEPTGNLDSVTGENIQEMLFRLNKERNITLIIVTHDKDLAKRCDRTIELRDGKIVKDI